METLGNHNFGILETLQKGRSSKRKRHRKFFVAIVIKIEIVNVNVIVNTFDIANCLGGGQREIRVMYCVKTITRFYLAISYKSFCDPLLNCVFISIVVR